MNTYHKFCPNVFLAKCTEQHEKGEVIQVQTKYGKENDSIVFNLIFEREGFFYYSIVRADGFNIQEHARRKAERLQTAALNASKRSDQYYEKSNTHKDFLVLAEPIKIGHHSERRHRRIIEQARENFSKCIEEQKTAEQYNNRASYWENRENLINESMPESIEYFEFKLEQAKKHHQALKDGTIPKSHSYSLPYAKKEVNEIEKKLKICQKLWGDHDNIQE
jgi:hypothetical protein